MAVLCVIALVALVSSFVSFRAQTASDSDVIAYIEQSGILLDAFHLAQVREPISRTYTHPQGNHYNIVLVEPGRIRVLEANCPEQVDVRCGWLTLPGQSAICLPHRFVVRLTSGKPLDSDLDAVIR